ncbi:MAG: HpcH/HpaI aldolase/citrate lyase family protein [Paracoccaceae bacterium]
MTTELPKNRFKERLRAGEVQYGIWVSIPHSTVAEAVAGAGFDWMTLDTEHAPAEVSAVLPMLQAAAPYPTECIVRPAENQTALIKRHLDQGAQTLILPYVQSRAEAEAAVAAVRYAPHGVRGVAGGTRASRFGRIRDYTALANSEICLIVQIETVEAIACLDDIASVDGVDAVFIGPADLAASMGYPGQTGHPEVKAKIIDTIGRARALGKPIGLLTLDKDFARECVTAGAGFVCIAIDMSILVRGADALAAEFSGSR